MPMSRNHTCGVWFQSGSGGVPGGGGVTLFRSTVEAAAAKPHRDGESQESCDRPAMLLSRMIPPLRTTSTSTETTSSGIVLSEELTAAEISRPIVIDAIASIAMASMI